MYVTINVAELFKCLFFLLQHLSQTSEIHPKIGSKNDQKIWSLKLFEVVYFAKNVYFAIKYFKYQVRVEDRVIKIQDWS